MNKHYYTLSLRITMYCNHGEFCNFSLSIERNDKLSRSSSTASFSNALYSSNGRLEL